MDPAVGAVVIAALERARQLAEAGNLDGAAREVLLAWREGRAPVLVALLDELTRRAPPRTPPRTRSAWRQVEQREPKDPLDGPRQLEALFRDLPQYQLEQRLGDLASRPGDPRLARRVLDLVEALPYRAPGSRELYDRAIAIVERGGGDDEATRLGALRDATAAVNNAGLRAWLVERITAAIAALPAPRALDVDERAAVDALWAAIGLAGREATGARATTATLLRAVYASPDDDAPRLVLADHLLDHGDPAGELIVLQCRGVSEADRGRERELIQRHGRDLLGPLAARVDPDGVRFERGLAVACRAVLHPPVDEAAEPAWSTIRALDVLGWPAPDDAAASAPFLRRLHAITGANEAIVDVLASAPSPLPLERLGIYSTPVPRDTFERVRAVAPRLVHLVLRPHADPGMIFTPLALPWIETFTIIDKRGFSLEVGLDLIAGSTGGARSFYLEIEDRAAGPARLGFHRDDGRRLSLTAEISPKWQSRLDEELAPVRDRLVDVTITRR